MGAIFWDASRHRLGQPRHLMISTKRVPAQRSHRRHVNCDWSKVASFGISATAAVLTAAGHTGTAPVSCSPPSLPFWSSCLSSVSTSQVLSVSTPIVPTRQGQQLALLPTPSSFSSSGRPCSSPFPSLVACPTSVGSYPQVSICPVCVSGASGPSARSAVCELSSGLLFLPLDTEFSGSSSSLLVGNGVMPFCLNLFHVSQGAISSHSAHQLRP